MSKKIRVGYSIRFSEFEYNNKAGGTSTANLRPIGELDTYFDGIGFGEVVKILYDYETGVTYHVWLSRFTWEKIQDKASENLAYVSEFDLLF